MRAEESTAVGDRVHKWLGVLRSGWAGARLLEVADAWTSNVDKHTVEGQPAVRLCNYVDVYKNDAITDSIDFMSASATREQIRKFRIRRDDTVITKDSETADDIGVPAFVEYEADDLICGYHLAIVRPDARRVVPKFLYWALDSEPTARQWGVTAAGVTRVGIRSTDLNKVTIALPPLDEQRAIADYLDRETAQIDALVAKQEEFIGLLRERRSAEISHAVQAAPSRVKLKYVAGAGQYGLNFPASEYVNTGTRLLRTSDLVGGRMTPSSDGIFVPEQAVSERDRLASGDLLLSRSGTVGRGFVVPPEAEGMTFAGFLVRFRPKPDMDGRYLGYCTQTAEFQRVVQSEAVSSTIQNFNADRYGNVDIPMLPIDAQLRVVNRLDEQTAQIDALISKAGEHIALAKERRAALITAAVTGQFNVRTARKAA